MRRILIFITALLAIAEGALAIDVSPSKDTIPRSSFDTGGNRFSIFNGDPKRIQRANEVNPKSFDAVVKILPNPISLKALEVVGPNPSIKISFSIHNHARRPYTLSFPTSQRWDFQIVSSSGAVIYAYTDDHEFVQAVGSSMVNPDDKLSYPETVEFNDMTTPLTIGVYTVKAVMANYPEITAQTTLNVQD